MINGGNGGGAGGTPFPDPPKGSPGEITAAARTLHTAADDLDRAHSGLNAAGSELEADWQGYAAAAYHSSSSTLASVARGGAETFRESAQAVTGYATALDHAQSEIRRLRQQWEDAQRRQTAADSLAGRLTGAVTSTTKPADANRLSHQASTCLGQAQDAGREADGYALRATTALNDFKRAAAGYQQTLEGYQPGHPGGPLGSPFSPLGHPGPGFGLPTSTFNLPGTGGSSHSLDPYTGVIPVGDPWHSPIPGYGVYKDATTPEAVPTNDLINLALLVGPIVSGPAVDLGAGALRSLAEQLGLGVGGRAAVDEARAKATQEAIDRLLDPHVPNSGSFAQGVPDAIDRGRVAAAIKQVEQADARAGYGELGLNAVDKTVGLPPGVKEGLTEILHRGPVYVGYFVARLTATRNGLLSVGTPAAQAAARAIAVILHAIGR
jgi:uncharacterized protein YukE